MYDTRVWLPHGAEYPAGTAAMEAYLNRADVRAALHAAPASEIVFKQCTDPPYFALAAQDGLGVVPQLRRVLDGMAAVVEATERGEVGPPVE